MVCSAIYVMDAKGKILISRNYRGDVTRASAERCVLRLLLCGGSGKQAARVRAPRPPLVRTARDPPHPPPLPP